MKKNSKTSHLDRSGHIEGDIMQNHEQKKKWKKKVKIQDFMGKTSFFLNTLPFSPWAILATWLPVGVPQKIQENELNTYFEQNFTMGCTESELGVLGVPRKLLKYVVYLSKRKI